MIDPRDLPHPARATLFQALGSAISGDASAGAAALTKLPQEELRPALEVLLTGHASLLLEVDEARAAADDAQLLLLQAQLEAEI